MELDSLRALRIIEGLCYLNDDEEGDTSQGKLINDIYMIAHSAQPTCCTRVHKNWREDALKIEQKLVDMKIFKPWGEKEESMEPLF